MTDPWIDPKLVYWVPGVMLGAGSAIYGILIGVFVGKPGFKTLMYAGDGILIMISLLLICLGVIGYIGEQPKSLCINFLLSGLIGLVVFSSLWFGIKSIFQHFPELK